MGRLMMSYVLDESSNDAEIQKTVPVIQTECSGPELPHYENWSASNAFDPDSEEFWQEQNVVYEAFVDDLSCPELSPSSSEASSDTDGNVMLNRRLAHRERRRRAENEQPAALEGYVASDGRLRMRHIRPVSATLRQMAIIATSTTVTDSQTPSESATTAPTIVDGSGDLDQHATPFPVRIEPFDPNGLEAIDDDQPLIPIRPVTPPSRASFAEMWSDLRSITHSPMPYLSQSPLDAVSPPPSVTPHIYTWDRSSQSPAVLLSNPASPAPIRARMSTGGRAPRRSLPPSISLMT